MLPTATGIRTAKNAFSLVEVLIAIGVLGIGLGMVMLVFPAAIMENRSSVNSVRGPIVCQNALAYAKEILRHDGSIDEEMKVLYHLQGDGTYRGLVLGRRLGAAEVNDYLLTAVVYKASSQGDMLELSPGDPPLDGTYMIMTLSEPELEKNDTVVASNGLGAWVESREADNYTLDRPLFAEDGLCSEEGLPKQYFTLTVGGEPWFAMSVQSVRTPLRE